VLSLRVTPPSPYPFPFPFHPTPENDKGGDHEGN
jgi:hypothetical protein